jgi:hypothetical protein
MANALLIPVVAVYVAIPFPAFAQRASPADTTINPSIDLSGNWRLTGTFVSGTPRLALKQDGDGLTGILTFDDRCPDLSSQPMMWEEQLVGHVTGDEVSLKGTNVRLVRGESCRRSGFTLDSFVGRLAADGKSIAGANRGGDGQARAWKFVR